MRHHAYALCGLLLISSATAQEREAPPNSRTAHLSGRVFAADTGKPLQGAIVHIVDSRAANPAERQGRWVGTDAEGRWEFRGLVAGRYTVSVSKSGYLKIEYRQQRPFERGKILELAAGQVLQKFDVTLPRGGAITGRIVDEFGDPMTAVVVRAMRHRYVDGQRRLIPLAEGLEALVNGGGDITDDLGQFRIYGLTPGEFKSGQQISGVEILLTRRAATLMGTVQDARGAAVSDYTVVAFSADGGKWGYQTRFVRSARPDQDGRFSIRALPPDDYLMIALEYVETGQELDPERLERWRALATKVTLVEGESKTLSLKLAH